MNDGNGKRWVYLFTGTLTLLFMGLIYAWSIFKVPFGEIYHEWTAPQMSLTFTISMIFFCLGGFAGGLLGKRFSARVRLLIAAVFLFAGFFGVSRLDPANSSASLTALYVLYGVLGGGGVGIGYNAVISTITKWFPDKVGLASGIMMMGFGLGGLLLGGVLNSLISKKGIFFTFSVLAMAITAVTVIGALIIKEPARKASNSAEGKTDQTSSDGARNYTAAEMMKTSAFWIFELWAVALNSAGLMVINSAANISVAFGGSVVLGMIVSLFNGAGRIVAGNNFDKTGRKISTVINTVFMLIAGVLLMTGAKTGTLIPIVAGLIFAGLAYGGVPTISSAYINKAFGAKNFPTNFSIANFSLLPAAILGPMISAKLLESGGGRYDSSFMALISFTAAALVLWIMLNAADKKRDN